MDAPHTLSTPPQPSPSHPEFSELARRSGGFQKQFLTRCSYLEWKKKKANKQGQGCRSLALI